MHSAAPPTSSGSRRSRTRATRLKSEWTVPCSIGIGRALRGGTDRVPRSFAAIRGVAAVAAADGEVLRERPLLRDRNGVAPVEHAAAQRDLPAQRVARLRRSALEAVEVAQAEHQVALALRVVRAEQ